MSSLFNKFTATSSSSTLPQPRPVEDHFELVKNVSNSIPPLITPPKDHVKLLLHHMRMGKGKSGFSNLKPFKTRLVSSLSSNSSSANTANQVNNAVTMNSGVFPDLTDITGLFDEMRVLKGELWYTFSVAALGAGLTPAACNAAVIFDPNLAAPSSSYQCLTQTHHTKPAVLLPGALTLVQPAFCTELKLMKFKMPSPIAPINSSDTVGSSWFTLDAGTAPEILTVQAYVSALGTAGISNFYYVLVLDVELRIRT
jgi:hypothetical protein